VSPPRPDVIVETELHQRRLSLARAWQSLARLPFVLGRLALDLVPVLAFVGAATMLLGTQIAISQLPRVIFAVVNAYALSRGLICVVRALGIGAHLVHESSDPFPLHQRRQEMHIDQEHH
jgi:hypothetical protein